MFINSGPFTDMKFIPASLAIAFANKVLPQPGGPHNKTPVGVFRPRLAKCSWYLIGA